MKLGLADGSPGIAPMAGSDGLTEDENVGNPCLPIHMLQN